MTKTLKLRVLLVFIEYDSAHGYIKIEYQCMLIVDIVMRICVSATLELLVL